LFTPIKNKNRKITQ